MPWSPGRAARHAGGGIQRRRSRRAGSPRLRSSGASTATSGSTSCSSATAAGPRRPVPGRLDPDPLDRPDHRHDHHDPDPTRPVDRGGRRVSAERQDQRGLRGGHASRAGSSDGAGDLMAEVLSEVTGLEIEHWLSIDFDGFREMVDAVGGVTIDNPVAFSYTNNGASHQRGRLEPGRFAAGEIHLDGAQALAYSRARFTSVSAGVDRLRALGPPGAGPRARCARSSVTAASARSCPGCASWTRWRAGSGPTCRRSTLPPLVALCERPPHRRSDEDDGADARRPTPIGQYILIPTRLDRAGCLRRVPGLPRRRAREADSDGVAARQPMRRRRRLRLADLPRLRPLGAVQLARLFGGRYRRTEGANILVHR